MELTELEQAFRDLTSDLVEPYLWSSDLVASYADQAEQEACSRRPLLTTSTDSTLCNITIVSGTSNYSRHQAILQVYSARLTIGTDIYNLFITNENEINFIDPDWFLLEAGTPEYLILTDTGFKLVPTPNANGTLNLSISHIPIYRISETGELSISEAHQYNLLYWMLHLAYSKMDADTFNADLSALNAMKFANHFGDPRDANIVKSVRTVRDTRAQGGWI